MAAILPEVTEIPHHYPDCCLSISTRLLQRLGLLQPPESTVISIGSGSGFLEALLQRRFPEIRVIGLEVNGSINKYLLPENAISVKGTWDIYDRSSKADTWLFVYPRSPILISHYLKLSEVPRTVVWLGPKRDWEDFRPPFLDFGTFDVEEVEDSGVASYETMVVLKKEDVISLKNASSLSMSQIDAI